MMKKETKEALIKSAASIYKMFPMVLGVIMLISLANAIIPKAFYTSFFRGNYVLDSFLGSALGSILAGHPITSYIIGGELLEQGVSLMAVTAFLVTWITVGLIQLPAESTSLGKKFAITRNITAFLFSILVAIITVAILGVL